MLPGECTALTNVKNTKTMVSFLSLTVSFAHFYFQPALGLMSANRVQPE